MLHSKINMLSKHWNWEAVAVVKPNEIENNFIIIKRFFGTVSMDFV